jgi:hypothetical protein
VLTVLGVAAVLVARELDRSREVVRGAVVLVARELDRSREVVRPAVVLVEWPSAGSWPVTIWTSTAALVAMNVASDSPATRRRIARTRRRRSASLSAAAARRLARGEGESSMSRTLTTACRNAVIVVEVRKKNR